MTIKHLFPPELHSLNLDFANELALDPRITYSRASTGTYTDANGIIRTAQVDEPRFDYNGGTGESLGLLIEEARTNLFNQSENVETWNSPVWTNTNNVAISPDGTQNAGSVVPDVGVSSQAMGRSVTISAPGDYTCSVFAKAKGLTEFRLRNTTQSAFPRASFTLTGEGTASTSDGTARIEKYPNGWYRCIFTSNVATTGTFNWQVGTNAGQAASDGVSGFYVWGMQVEKGSFSTSLIPTTGSAASRAADLASIEGTNFSSWYNQSEGTLFYDYSSNVVSGSQFCSPASIRRQAVTNNSQSWGYWMYNGAGQARSPNAGQRQTPNEFIPLGDSIFTQTDVGREYKAAVAHSGSSLSACLEGYSVKTLTITPITNMNMLAFGYIRSINVYFSGHISRITYWPVRLADEYLVSLTA